MSNNESTTPMLDAQFENQLKRMFADKTESLSAKEFTQTLQPQLRSAYRRKVAIQWGIAVTTILFAALLTPLVVKFTLNAFLAADHVSRLPIMKALSAAGMVIITGIVWMRSRARIRSL